MRDLVFAFILVVTLGSCSLYESHGRKTFRDQGKDLVEDAKEANTEEAQENFDQIMQAGLKNCERINPEEAETFKHVEMTIYKAEHETYYFSYSPSDELEYLLIAPQGHRRPIELCFPQDS